MPIARNGWDVSVFIISSRRVRVFSVLITISILAMLSSSAANGTTRKHKANARKVSARAARVAQQRTAVCGLCRASVKTTRRSTSKARPAKVNLAKEAPCHPKGYVDPKIARNFNAAMRDMKRAGIKPMVTSAWRSSEYQARLHNCSGSRRCRRANPGLYRAMPPGRSLHEAGLAVDMSGIAAGPRGAKRLTPRGRRIVGIMQKNGFRWRYGLADPAHFEADPRKAGYRNARQAIARSQNICDANLPASARSDKRPARNAQTTPGARRVTYIRQVSPTKQRRHITKA
jgi:LAS superfamily LD-carboxypeptidase LdcB